MKKKLTKTIRYSLIVAILLFIGACKKQTNLENASLNDINKNLNKEVSQMTSLTAKSIAFSKILNKEERFEMVINHLNYVLNNENLDNQQKTLLQELINNIPSDLYNSDKKLIKIFKENYSNNWKQRALPVFGKDNFTKYFMRIGKLGSEGGGITQSLEVEPDKPKDCNCLTSDPGSDCESTQDCVSPGVTPCWDTIFGCGFLYIDSCNGTCKKKPVDVP